MRRGEGNKSSENVEFYLKDENASAMKQKRRTLSKIDFIDFKFFLLFQLMLLVKWFFPLIGFESM